MTKVGTWFALAFVAIMALGCGEVEKCKRGEPGCIGGRPGAEGCTAGLEVAPDGTCQPKGGGGGQVDACDNACGSDEICGDDGNCIGYCQSYNNPVTSIRLPPACRNIDDGSLLSFEATCIATCMQRCIRNEALCTGFKCDPTSCYTVDSSGNAKASEVAQLACRGECPGAAAACMVQVCEKVRDNDCAGHMCPPAYAKDCTDVLCRNNCKGQTRDNAGDGFCDDGDPRGSDYSICAYGNDCGDCGPRRGPKLDVAPIGGSCVVDTGCGFKLDFFTSPAWCVTVNGAPIGQSSCVPNCTSESSDKGDPSLCSPGYECRGLFYAGSSQTPYTDFDGNQAFACMPLVCE